MFRNLKADEIEVKVKQVKENGLVALLYKTARTDMELLDETVGPYNWTTDYREIKGNLYAGIAIRNEDGHWIWKWDCGIESREDEEGNQKKGEASDAFKRAGFRWGIGRALYTSPFIWIAADCANIRANQNGKGHRCSDSFSVDTVEYDENGRICKLTIRNDNMRKIAFSWGTNKETPKPAPAKANQPAPASIFTCADCGQVIEAHQYGKTNYTASQVAANTKKKYGRSLCWDCAQKAAAAGKAE